MKSGSFLHVTIGESLISDIEPLFLWFADIQVTHDHVNGVRIWRPVWCDETWPFPPVPLGYVRLEVDVDDLGILTVYARNGHDSGKWPRALQQHHQARGLYECMWLIRPSFRLFGMNVPYSRNCGSNM